MRLTDLVVLQNVKGHVQVVSPRDIEGLEINLNEKTFDYLTQKNVPFGKGDHFHCTGCIIGVYIKKDLEHLTKMVHDGAEIISPTYD